MFLSVKTLNLVQSYALLANGNTVVGHKYTYKTMAVLAVVYGLAVCVCTHSNSTDSILSIN